MLQHSLLNRVRKQDSKAGKTQDMEVQAIQKGLSTVWGAGCGGLMQLQNSLERTRADRMHVGVDCHN